MKEQRQKETREGVFEGRINELKIKGWKVQIHESKYVPEEKNKQKNVDEGRKSKVMYKKRSGDMGRERNKQRRNRNYMFCLCILGAHKALARCRRGDFIL